MHRTSFNIANPEGREEYAFIKEHAVYCDICKHLLALAIYLFIYVSNYLFICLCIFLSIYLIIYVSIHLFIYIYIYTYIYLFYSSLNHLMKGTILII